MSQSTLRIQQRDKKSKKVAKKHEKNSLGIIICDNLLMFLTPNSSINRLKSKIRFFHTQKRNAVFNFNGINYR